MHTILAVRRSSPKHHKQEDLTNIANLHLFLCQFFKEVGPNISQSEGKSSEVASLVWICI